jgi:hypothetical protein
VIDALDECEKNSDVKQVLHLLSAKEDSVSGYSLPAGLKYLSDMGFRSSPDQQYQDFVLRNISRSIVDHDIFTFLQHALVDIQRKCALDENWPGEEAIRYLVLKAAGLIKEQYARTCV